MGELSGRAQKDDLAKSGSARSETLRRAKFDTSSFVTRKGLLLPKQISFDKWMGVGSYLSNIFSSSAWCLGDWLVYGEATFNGRYQDAIKLTSLDYQTLRNHAWVARRFPMSRRRDALSFTHHAEVAALSEPEQDFWLRKAEEYAWSAKRLRREVKASLRERETENTEIVEVAGQDQSAEDVIVSASEETVMLSVSVSAGCLESCNAAASRLGLNLEAWASRVLLVAAAQVPDERLPSDPLQDRDQHAPAGEGDDSQPEQRTGVVRNRGRAERGPIRRSVRQVR
ncbi:LmbU family transcriptional regulator [Streptomyces sp. 900105755]